MGPATADLVLAAYRPFKAVELIGAIRSNCGLPAGAIGADGSGAG
jgi:hypothetical protein